jgi:predicted nucleic acid-binding protein
MSRVFVDTSYLLALVNQRDVHHAQAMTLRELYPRDLVTTEYIMLEVLDALVVGDQRNIAMEIVNVIRADRGITLVAANTARLDQGLKIFAQHKDKDWGITDCISFAVMREGGITAALTADHHFKQAGFQALLLSAPAGP